MEPPDKHVELPGRLSFTHDPAYPDPLARLNHDEVMSQFSDQWAAGSTYEQFMGRWSRKLASQYVAWLRPAVHLHWLDLGCGTGALTGAIFQHTAPASVMACDPAEPFVEYARQHVRRSSATFIIASADDFPVRDGGYDVIASLLALNFFSDPPAALDRMRKASTPGGLITACVWDYAGEMQFLRFFWEAAAGIDDRAGILDEGKRFPLCAPDKLISLFGGAGLVDVRCEAIEITTEFADFNDYWTPLLGGTGPAPAFVASLNEENRERLRTSLERTLSREAAGPIHLRARAWAVRGNAPTA